MNNAKSYEEYLKKNGHMTYKFSGCSMNPMLKEKRDLFTVAAKTEERCKKYDVVLYKRPPEHYVLHRIVAVKKQDYVILGDNCISKEYHITDEDIIGVLTSFVRKGKTISVNDLRYRVYARVWYFCYPVRKIFLKIKVFIRNNAKKAGRS